MLQTNSSLNRVATQDGVAFKVGVVGVGEAHAVPNRAERTPEVVAVSLYEAGGPGGVPGPSPSPASVAKQTSGAGQSPAGVRGNAPRGKARYSKTARWARKTAWLKSGGGYVHYSLTRCSQNSPEIVSFKNCHHWWYLEKQGDKKYYQSSGCGQRLYCPLCGSYKQLVLAQGSAEDMLLVMESLEINEGFKLDSYGLTFVLTIPREQSLRIDQLLVGRLLPRKNEITEWQIEMKRLFAMGSKFIKKRYGSGVGYVQSIDYTGESDPTTGHYHLNIWLLPARRVGHKWQSISHWQTDNDLVKMRADWAGIINHTYGLNLPEVNLRVGYLGTSGQLRSWLQYTYKHQLCDLWRGWQVYHSESGDLEYSWDSGRKSKVIMMSGLDRCFDRLESAPDHFKRVRWFGILSDGLRGKTMKQLGLDKLEESDEVEIEEEKWARQEGSFEFVRYTKAGMQLRPESVLACKPKTLSPGALLFKQASSDRVSDGVSPTFRSFIPLPIRTVTQRLSRLISPTLRLAISARLNPVLMPTSMIRIFLSITFLWVFLLRIASFNFSISADSI